MDGRPVSLRTPLRGAFQVANIATAVAVCDALNSGRSHVEDIPDAAVQAAQSAVDLARQTFDADQQKLKVGLTTQTAILQDASTLTTSESNLVSAKAAYEKSRIELDRATGALLDHAGIDITDATRGQVTHLPNVPYVAPRQDAQPVSAQQPSGQ